MYIQITFVVFKISVFVEQVGTMVPSMEHKDPCIPYVTDHNCKSIIIRKYDVIIRYVYMNSFYVTECWKNVELVLLIELKINCETDLILIQKL
jgi:hypothetical protein